MLQSLESLALAFGTAVDLLSLLLDFPLKFHLPLLHLLTDPHVQGSFSDGKQEVTG